MNTTKELVSFSQKWKLRVQALVANLQTMTCHVTDCVQSMYSVMSVQGTCSQVESKTVNMV